MRDKGDQVFDPSCFGADDSETIIFRLRTRVQELEGKLVVAREALEKLAKIPCHPNGNDFCCPCEAKTALDKIQGEGERSEQIGEIGRKG